MRKLLVLLAAVAALLTLVGPGTADPGASLEDEPGEEQILGDDLGGTGLALEEEVLEEQPAGSAVPRAARNMSLVGSLRLEPFNVGVHADVYAFRNLAFIGKWRGACPGTGVDIIDISNPTRPAKLSDTADHPNTSFEDMQARMIGDRMVLAVGLQDCGNDPTNPGLDGLELIDITDPRNPQPLAFFKAPLGVHELDLTTHGGNRHLALLAVPFSEVATSNEQGLNGTGDLIIVDITDPTKPTQIGEWGVLDEPALGPEFFEQVGIGEDRDVFAHSVRETRKGTRAFVSYWDAGVIVLDLTDPTKPRFLGRTTFPGDAEGNAHSVDAAGGNFVVQADEDFSPFTIRFRITEPAALAREARAVAATFGPLIANQPNKTLAGQIVHVGRGCAAGTIEPNSPEDPYLGNPAGKIALIERGACRFDTKVARAQLAGAVGVIVYQSEAGGEDPLPMGGESPVPPADQGGGAVGGTTLTIPAFMVGRSAGVAMRDAAAAGQTVAFSALSVFQGWGFLRFYDVSNPSRAVQLGTFATPNTRNEAATLQGGQWSAHNPERRGNLVYASWYSDGVRVIDISRPSRPREVAFWRGMGAPPEAELSIWGVWPHGNYVLASDQNFGLFVLKLHGGR